jgi:hypothetical protein
MLRSTSLRCLAGCFLLAAACGPSETPCGQDTDCDPDQICGPDGYCVDVDAGTDGGGADGGCAQTCAGYQACVNGACLSLYTALQITSPQQNGFVGASVEIDAALALVCGLTPNDPATLNFTATPLDGGVETGTIALLGAETYSTTWMPAQEGEYTLVASYPAAGLESTPIMFTVLKTGPVFQLQVPTPVRDAGWQVDPAPGYANAWRRNEIVTVGVTSTDPNVDIGIAQLILVGVQGDDAGMGGPVLPVNPTTGCGQATCGTVAVDLSAPQFEAFRGVVGLSLIGQDLAGNQGTATASLPVTRWEWARPTGAPLAGPPAIGHLGTVYAPATAGGLVALDPLGNLLWTMDAGSLQTGVAISAADAGDVLYTALSSGTGALLAALDGTQGSTLASCSVDGGVAVGLALLPTTIVGQTLESAVAVFNDTPSTSQLVALRFGAPAGSQCFAAVGVPLMTDAGNLVSDGVSSVFYADVGGNLQSYTFDGGWPTVPTWSAGPFSASALAMAPGELVCTGGVSPAGVFAEALSGGSPSWSYSDGGTALASVPVVGDGGIVFYGDNSGSWTIVAVGTPAPIATLSSRSPPSGAMLLGNGGALYGVDGSGNVTAWDQSFDTHWSISGSQPGWLAIDCPRGPGGLPLPAIGTLYVASGDGTIYAFVTDSIGLDTTAPWPKSQHDPRNSGSAGTALAEFVCF